MLVCAMTVLTSNQTLRVILNLVLSVVAVTETDVFVHRHM